MLVSSKKYNDVLYTDIGGSLQEWGQYLLTFNLLYFLLLCVVYMCVTHENKSHALHMKPRGGHWVSISIAFYLLVLR